MYDILFMHSSIDGHLGCFHPLAIVNKNRQCIETELKQSSGCKVWEKGRVDCLMGMGFPFGVLKIFWNRQKRLLHNIVNVHNATELYPLE